MEETGHVQKKKKEVWFKTKVIIFIRTVQESMLTFFFFFLPFSVSTVYSTHLTLFISHAPYLGNVCDWFCMDRNTIRSDKICLSTFSGFSELFWKVSNS